MRSSGAAVCWGWRASLAFPLGIGAGNFLAEFGRGTKLANAVRFTADILNGVPSIVMGVAAYALIVRPAEYPWMPFLGHFSGPRRPRGPGDHDGSDDCADHGRDIVNRQRAMREAALRMGVAN